jgi:ribonuclease P protein component
MPALPMLRSSRDFHRVRSTGARARSDGVTVWIAAGTPGGPARLGLTARSRSAVERNRIRRRLRAAWSEVDLRPGRDVVIGADRAALEPAFQELVNHVKTALTRAEGRS